MLSYFLNFYGKTILEKGHVHFLGMYSVGHPGTYPGNPTDLLSAESCLCVFSTCCQHASDCCQKHLMTTF